MKVLDRILKVKNNTKINNGINNKLVIIDDNNKTKNCYINNLIINFHGNNSTIVIHKDANLKKELTINCMNNNYIYIGKSDNLNFGVSTLSDGCELIIKNNCDIYGAYFVLHDEPNLKVEIGNNCLVSTNVLFRPSDGHTIFDKDKQIVNYPQDIIVGEHVWIGNDCTILKGAHIPNNCIIGIKSLVTKGACNDENSVYAGVPVKLLKHSVDWSKVNTHFFST